MNIWVAYFVLLNGVYDIACAFATLAAPESSVAELHLAMFRPNTDETNRLMAYWLLTYGTIRLFAAFTWVPAITYAVEALCYAGEAAYGREDKYNRAAFVALFSVVVLILMSI